MALVFTGTPCKLCGLPLDENREIDGFLHFVANAADPLWPLSDGAFHRECLEKDALGRQAMEFAGIARRRIDPGNRICCIDNKPVANPQDYLFIPLLTSDPNEKVFKYNFLTFNRNNIGKWENRKEFIEDLKEFNNQGKWKDFQSHKFMDHLISEFQINR